MTRPRGKVPVRRRANGVPGNICDVRRDWEDDGIEEYETSGVCPCCSHPALPMPQLQLSNILSGIFLKRLEWDILRLYATRIYWISKKKLVGLIKTVLTTSLVPPTWFLYNAKGEEVKEYFRRGFEGDWRELDERVVTCSAEWTYLWIRAKLKEAGVRIPPTGLQPQSLLQHTTLLKALLQSIPTVRCPTGKPNGPRYPTPSLIPHLLPPKGKRKERDINVPTLLIPKALEIMCDEWIQQDRGVMGIGGGVDDTRTMNDSGKGKGKGKGAVVGEEVVDVMTEEMRKQEQAETLKVRLQRGYSLLQQGLWDTVKEFDVPSYAQGSGVFAGAGGGLLVWLEACKWEKDIRDREQRERSNQRITNGGNFANLKNVDKVPQEWDARGGRIPGWGTPKEEDMWAWSLAPLNSIKDYDPPQSSNGKNSNRLSHQCGHDHGYLSPPDSNSRPSSPGSNIGGRGKHHLEFEEEWKEFRSLAGRSSEERFTRAEELKDDGNVEFKKGNYHEAIRFYTEAHEYENRLPVYVLNRAMAYLKLSDFKSAEADCTWVLKRHRLNTKALWRRSRARIELGKMGEIEKFREAEDDLVTFLSLDPPDSISAVKDLAELRAQVKSKVQQPSPAPSPASATSSSSRFNGHIQDQQEASSGSRVTRREREKELEESRRTEGDNRVLKFGVGSHSGSGHQNSNSDRNMGTQSWDSLSVTVVFR